MNILKICNSFTPKWLRDYSPCTVTFNGNLLKRHSVSFIHKNVVEILYISWKLDTWSKDTNTDFALDNSLFESVKLTKNADPDHYRYSGYGIGCNGSSDFYWSDGSKSKSFFFWWKES